MGLPLCRDEGYLAGCRGFASSIMISIAVLKLLPAWTRFALGYLAVSPNWWYYRKASRYLLPIIRSRLDQVEQNPKKDPSSILPNDFITWSIVYALESPDPRERDPVLISKRVMTTNFAAIHTTTLTSTNMLIDLLGSDPKWGYLEALTAEIEAVDKVNTGQWSKLALGAMTRTDSALRESMRYSGFVNIGVERKVIAKEGVTISDGTHNPYWANIATPAWGIHHDEEIYARPFEYDALRFSNQREALGEGGGQVHVGEEGLVEGEEGYNGSEMNGSTKPEKDLSKVLEGKNLSTVTTSSQFMQFGKL